MTKQKAFSTYWECRLCRCTWSGSIDIEEMKYHYSEDHPEADQTYLLDETDFMQKKVSVWDTKKQSKKSSAH